MCGLLLSAPSSSFTFCHQRDLVRYLSVAPKQPSHSFQQSHLREICGTVECRNCGEAVGQLRQRSTTSHREMTGAAAITATSAWRAIQLRLTGSLPDEIHPMMFPSSLSSPHCWEGCQGSTVAPSCARPRLPARLPGSRLQAPVASWLLQTDAASLSHHATQIPGLSSRPLQLAGQGLTIQNWHAALSLAQIAFGPFSLLFLRCSLTLHLGFSSYWSY